MSQTERDLWPSEVSYESVVPPVVILREQGARLREKTKGLVVGQVESTDQLGEDVEDYVQDLRTLGDLDKLPSDVREQRFTLHTLQLAAQAALDVASHIVSDDRIGEPRTNRELFHLLARHGWIDANLAGKLEDMAGFRNVLVHGYADLDLDLVADVVRHRLDDLLAFAAAIRERL